MKLQIAFDTLDLEKALKIAECTEKYADILEVGTLLLYKHGEEAIKKFKEKFPQKTILADAKIADHTKDSITLLAQAGADWITVLSGINRDVIHAAAATAHEYGKKIMLDLVDSSSLGQSALEAKSLGVDALLFHKSAHEDPLVFQERWEMVKGNTTVPVFISCPVTRENITDISSTAAAGIIISKAIVQSAQPAEEAAFFAAALNQ